ncbi:transposable element Tc1 transposase [Trichonephila clavipes]|nr:transposable element Tc1 transposase [Trichonephila clavipes]
MIWCVILFNSWTPLVVIRCTLTSQGYVDHILGTVLLPFIQQYLGFIWQQDNARPQNARVAMKCLTACQTLHWLSRSPDISPVIHAWDMMER